jgi:hypothetical protein
VLSRNNCSPRKAISITYSECVSVALFIQYAKLKFHIILSPMACMSLSNFTTLSHKQHDFLKKKSQNTKCVFWWYLKPFSETFLILRRTQRDMIINVYRSLCNVPTILIRLLSRFNIKRSIKNQHMHWIIPFIYSMYRLLHVSAVVCHHQGASMDPCEVLEMQNK